MKTDNELKRSEKEIIKHALKDLKKTSKGKVWETEIETIMDKMQTTKFGRKRL